MQIARDESCEVLKVAGTLDIGASREFQKALRDALDGGPAVILDLSAVEQCDITGLQLLCSARKSADRASKSLEVRSISDAVARTAAALGFPMDALAGAKHPEQQGGPAGAI